MNIGKRELALEAGLYCRGRISQGSRERRRMVSRYLLDLAHAAQHLSQNDRAILEALVQEGSISAAASALRPGKPGYRRYVQKCFKRFEQLAEKFGQRLAFLERLEEGA